MLKEGTEARKEIVVTKENTANVMGSGEIEVFATPAMVALMENVAYERVAGQLEEGQGTVVTSMNVKHLSATPVGMKVVCESKLVKVDKRALTFEIKAFDEAGIIGEAIHERFIIENEKFTKKAYSKLEN